MDIYLTDENTVNKAYRISGEEFNPSDKDGVWLTDAFAQKRGIKVGDDFTVKYAGGTFTKKVKVLSNHVNMSTVRLMAMPMFT